MTQDELRATVEQLVRDVKTHDDLIRAIQAQQEKISGELSGIRELVVQTNARTNVYMEHIFNQNKELVSLLTETQKAREASEIDFDRMKIEMKQQTQNALWKTLSVAVGSGGAIAVLINLLLK